MFAIGPIAYSGLNIEINANTLFGKKLRFVERHTQS